MDWVSTGDEAKHRLGQNKYDLLLLEGSPQVLALLRHVKKVAPSLPVVLVFDKPNEAVAKEAGNYGVICALIQPVRPSHIDDLFNVFKIRVRSCENTRYLESRAFSVGVPAAL